MQASKFVASYFDAWNHADPVGVADHLTPDGVYIDVPENIPRTHDELIDSLAGFFADFPHRYELIGEILTSKNMIAFQYQVHAAEADDADAFSSRSLCLELQIGWCDAFLGV